MDDAGAQAEAPVAAQLLPLELVDRCVCSFCRPRISISSGFPVTCATRVTSSRVDVGDAWPHVTMVAAPDDVLRSGS